MPDSFASSRVVVASGWPVVLLGGAYATARADLSHAAPATGEAAAARKTAARWCRLDVHLLPAAR